MLIVMVMVYIVVVFLPNKPVFVFLFPFDIPWFGTSHVLLLHLLLCYMKFKKSIFCAQLFYFILF